MLKIGLSYCPQYKRDTSEDTEVRGPFNVNKQSRYVELVLVADNGEYHANGENIHTVHRQLKDVANIINSVSVFTGPFLVSKIVARQTSHHLVITTIYACPCQMQCILGIYIALVLSSSLRS